MEQTIQTRGLRIKKPSCVIAAIYHHLVNQIWSCEIFSGIMKSWLADRFNKKAMVGFTQPFFSILVLKWLDLALATFYCDKRKIVDIIARDCRWRLYREFFPLPGMKFWCIVQVRPTGHIPWLLSQPFPESLMGIKNPFYSGKVLFFLVKPPPSMHAKKRSHSHSGT